MVYSRMGKHRRGGRGRVKKGCSGVTCLCFLAFLALLKVTNPGLEEVARRETQAFRRRGGGDDDSSLFANRLKHVGSFGLGHRFSKLSAALDLARRLNLPILEVEWKDCGIDLFADLFGSSAIPLRNVEEHDYQSKTVIVRNDVAGYYAGQAYKNTRQRVTSSRRAEWLQKMEDDFEFYSKLFGSASPAVELFQKTHAWHNRTVIGVHVRAGNGEGDHFSASQRQVEYDPVTVSKALRPLLSAATNPLVFVATDTTFWIDALRSELSGVDVVAFPQDRVPFGEGVSYQQWNANSQACIQGWQSAVKDMTLLSASDILVAVSRSTFTQIVPALLVLHREGQFCEMSGSSLDCSSTVDEWLFRRRQHPHKVMVHLPDVNGQDKNFDEAKRFVKSRELLPPSGRSYFYGPKFNKKYRKSTAFQSFWNLDG